MVHKLTPGFGTFILTLLTVLKSHAALLPSNMITKQNRTANGLLDESGTDWSNDFDSEDEALIGASDDYDDFAEEDDIYGFVTLPTISSIASCENESICFNYRTRGEKKNKFTIHVKTLMKHGLIIWLNQGPTLQGDFMSLAIADGYVELSFNLGKKTNPVRIKSKVNARF